MILDGFFDELDKLAKDMIPGGKADNKTDKDFNKRQLDMGQKVEMEHTNDPKKAREIARDHLSESPEHNRNYYSKLKSLESKLEKKAASIADMLRGANKRGIVDDETIEQLDKAPNVYHQNIAKLPINSKKRIQAERMFKDAVKEVYKLKRKSDDSEVVAPISKN